MQTLEPRRLILVLLAAVATSLASCRDASMKKLQDRSKQMRDYEKRKILVPKDFDKTKQRSQPRPQASRQSLDAISRAYDSTRSVSRSTGTAEEVAMRKVAAALNASLELGPTLIVWLVDRTPSAQRLVTQASSAAKAIYDEPDIRQLALGGEQQLLSSVVAFDDKTEFTLDPPSADPQAVQDAFDKIAPSTGGREQTFAAVKEALDKYLPYRTDATARREVLLVIVTDEAGDDAAAVDELAALVKRHAVPVYCLGSPAPWGQTSPLAADPKKGDPTKADDSVPVYGPESHVSERVDIQMTRVSLGSGGGSENLDLIDSGFGPLALERLCRAGGGQFFAIRPDSGSQYNYAGQSYSYWPSGSELRFAEGAASRYAPEYVSAEEHGRLVAASKTRQALTAAAQLPKLAIEDFPDLRFPKLAEAQMKRTLDAAQQYAARHTTPIDRLYAVLAAGEADRDAVTTPRIAAQFDLAFGRVLAVKARIDGYNSMIAALKRGKTFANAGSTVWILEPADAYETESTIKKLAQRAKVYLDRVVQQHPGTPWARLAEEELRSPLGWTWKEG